jgi:hypothetical protein
MHWEGTFKDPMTPAAAIDRLVHHSVAVELNIPSYRMEEAKKNQDRAPESNVANSAEHGPHARAGESRPWK